MVNNPTMAARGDDLLSLPLEANTRVDPSPLRTVPSNLMAHANYILKREGRRCVWRADPRQDPLWHGLGIDG
jgi:hypothetical protein